MKLEKALYKELCKLIKEEDFPQEVIDALQQNPSAILGTIRKVRVRRQRDITLGTSNNTKTHYGFLYSQFSNIKIRLDLDNYDLRGEFTDKWLSDKKFIKMFNKYIESNFDKSKRPAFKGDSLHSLELIKAKVIQKQVVRDIRSGCVVGFYDDAEAAAVANGLSPATIQSYLNKSRSSKNRHYYGYRNATAEEVKLHKKDKLVILDIS